MSKWQRIGEAMRRQKTPRLFHQGLNNQSPGVFPGIPAGARVTETAELRVTETGETRVTE